MKIKQRKRNVTAPKTTDPANRFFQAILLIAVFLVPLIYNPFGYDFYEAPKFVVLALTVLMLVSLKVYFSLKDTAFSFFRTPIDMPWLAWLAVSALAALGSLNAAQSLWGREPRYDGLLSLLLYAIIFWFSFQTTIEDRAFAKRAVLATAGAGVIVSLYALAQYAGFDLITWQAQVGQTGRAFATAGSAMHLGAYLSLVAPLGFFLLITESDRRQRTAITLGCLLILAAVLVSYSRAAWLALIIAFIFWLIADWQNRGQGRRLAVVAGAILLVLIMIAVIRPPSRPDQISLWPRLASIFNPSSSSNAERFIAWQATWKATADRPLLGWGQETFGLVFPKYQPARWNSLNNQRPMDKPHNFYLEVLVSTGILGLAALIWLIVKSGNRLLNFLSRPAPDKPIVYALTASLIAYMVQAAFGFNMVGVTPIFYLLLGTVLALVSANDKNAKRITLKFSGTFAQGPIAYIPFVIFLTALSVLALRPLAADRHLRRGVDYLDRGDYSSGQNELAAAVKNLPASDAYRRAWARAYLIDAQNSGSSPKFNRAIELFNEARALSPGAAQTYEDLGEAYLWAWRRLKRLALGDAEKAFGAFVRLSPNSPKAHFKLGYVLALREKTAAALEHWRQTARLDSNYPSLPTNMAIAYLKLGHKQAARAAIGEALKANPKDTQAKALLNELGR